MTIQAIGRAEWTRKGLTVAALIVALQGCNLKQVQIPGLSGPSELGLALRMTATPDALVADDVSTSVITVLVRDQNGHPLAGQALEFRQFDGNGNFADIGALLARTATTDGTGVAHNIYRAPARTDILAHTSVRIGARPATGDFTGPFNGVFTHTIGIEIIPAETNLFPQNPNRNCPTIPTQCPFAGFVTEPAFNPVSVGQQVLFQSISHDTPDAAGHVGTIVRFQWDFGDGTTDVKPDVNHAFTFAGTFTVSLAVTDSDGAQGIARGTVIVQ
jgi:hypothetical protein